MSDGNEPDLTLRYADHACGLLDVHLPAGEPSGRVVLVVHGGFWKASIDREHTRPQARALADLGHVVVTPEYRRVPESLAARALHPRSGGGGWPTTGEDVRDALEETPSVLAAAGVPGGPVTVVGHSAGGHLALWLAATGAAVARTVALAPVCDLGEAARRDLGGGAATRLLGGLDPAVADPMALLDARPAGPVTVVHGRSDVPVPVELSRGLVARHPWITYDEIDADHMALVDPSSAAWPHVVTAVQG